jgi:hypothetical protein
LAADLDPITDLERLLMIQVPGRDHLVATPQLIAIANPSHRDQDDTRNGPDIPSVLQRASSPAQVSARARHGGPPRTTRNSQSMGPDEPGYGVQGLRRGARRNAANEDR